MYPFFASSYGYFHLFRKYLVKLILKYFILTLRSWYLYCMAYIPGNISFSKKVKINYLLELYIYDIDKEIYEAKNSICFYLIDSNSIVLLSYIQSIRNLVFRRSFWDYQKVRKYINKTLVPLSFTFALHVWLTLSIYSM
jgi:hypothetical protein